MLFATRLLVEKLFRYGLPFRGVINYGDYIIEKNCFAGKVIVESYQYTNNLNIAAVVTCDNYKKIIQIINNDLTNLIDKIDDDEIKESLTTTSKGFLKIYNTFFKDYYIPHNDGKEDMMKTFDLRLALQMTKDESSNISQFVHNLFWKHNKDIPNNVQNKVDNTIKLIRYLNKS